MRKMMKELAIALLIFSMVFGTVYAITYILQGKITATVNVEQWVLVDGEVMPEAGNLVETVQATGGSWEYGDLHTLRLKDEDYVDKILVVTLDSSVTFGDPETMSVIHEFKLAPTTEGDLAQKIGDEDDLRLTNGETVWGDFVSITFEYQIESGPSDKIPHVNIALGNAEAGVCASSAEVGIIGGDWATVTYAKSDFKTLWGTPTDDMVFGPKYGFTIESGNPSEDPNSADDLQVVWVRNISALKTGDKPIEITGIRLVPIEETGNIPAQVIDFRIGYLPTDANGQYTVETEIRLMGEAKAGTYFP